LCCQACTLMNTHGFELKLYCPYISTILSPSVWLLLMSASQGTEAEILKANISLGLIN
jgi:hypothetical protein